MAKAKKRIARKKPIVAKKVKMPVRRAVKKIGSRKVPRRIERKPVRVKNKRRLAFKNLILFAIIFLITKMLYSVSNNEILVNLFWLLSIISFFVALAFLIVWLVLVLLKLMRRR